MVIVKESGRYYTLSLCFDVTGAFFLGDDWNPGPTTRKQQLNNSLSPSQGYLAAVATRAIMVLVPKACKTYTITSTCRQRAGSHTMSTWRARGSLFWVAHSPPGHCLLNRGRAKKRGSHSMESQGYRSMCFRRRAANFGRLGHP